MLYLTGDVALIVLESANIEKIKSGMPAKTPDGKVIIAWTPDPVWLADKIMDSDGSAAEIARLIDESTKRPQKPDRPKHETHTHDFQRDSLLRQAGLNPEEFS